LDLFLLLPRFSGFLSMIEQVAPAPPAEAAARLAQKATARWQRAIENLWHDESKLDMTADDAAQIEPADSDRLLAWIFKVAREMATLTSKNGAQIFCMDCSTGKLLIFTLHSRLPPLC
jgi:hypothetical protein